MVLHDTKLFSIDFCVVNQVRGHGDWGFPFSPFIGLAGRILCCWDKLVFDSFECVIEQRFVAMKVNG